MKLRTVEANPAALDLLGSEPRIALLGDVHGDLDHLRIALDVLHERGIRAVIQLGDFGLLWPRTAWERHAQRITRRLAELGQALFFADGNHEDFERLAHFTIDPATGLPWITSRIAHLPRGYRITRADGQVLAALGGAGSIDFERRALGSSWWLEEQINDEDLARAMTAEPPMEASRPRLGDPQGDGCPIRRRSPMTVEGSSR
ncbi:MAG TPA: metallophosphoesterase family protein [Microbacteriaceae bacterium]|nr:metallophosphoesterase family protein [Microbacteriaceae bacterium]